MTLRIAIYNTLSRKKEEFIPIVQENVGIYVCGPTVYGPIHLGNARSCTIFDSFVRFLRHAFASVTYVRNLTDVDDKINDAARARKISIKELTEGTTDMFHRDSARILNLPPDIEPRATDHIEEMISLIVRMIESGHAYARDYHVLFDVSSFPNYGSLSRMPMDQIVHGARVEVATYKDSPEDFVLWKPSKAGEPGWDSPWGYGRPGWHIECSAMSYKYLGAPFDIHGGGNDLIFPHHENEIAQSCAALEEELLEGQKGIFARYWMHNNMLIVNGEKMSKSLGNFILLKDALEKFNGEVIRWALLSTHYRHVLNWEEQLLQQSLSCIDHLYTSIRKYDDGIPAVIDEVSPDEAVLECLCDDFNTPSAMRRLQEIAKETNKLRGSEGAKHAAILKKSAQLLGFLPQKADLWFKSIDKHTQSISTDVIEALIYEREKARKEKDFALSDSIRNKLNDLGVELEDSADGKTSWKLIR
ncbi:cysteine--tRNA ligase [Candidatus Hydrogenosomobacter endosymbioticus]|uniref:Cysteine--tRNA ligase n=1 Tax=Candidatus Hydrogenosomobacter endosymbioticus TaxID=2558174 RepID=A0ABM7V958_9PROT|nr:cysteine--tRNA ligase [Candidatus Hydrogenosomobacter endosymbioticus]BDB96295.1 cysteine--tRNA ligase [Candidatus Hydrogenosomobacter endosymbioticus]